MSIRLVCRIGFFIALTGIIGGSLVPDAMTELRIADYDKVTHLAAYFALAMLAALGWPRWRGVALVSLPLIGLALEAGQSATGRNFEWTDALANAAGIGIAVAISAILTSWLSRE